MGFNDLASNQLVSFNEMQSSGIPLNTGQSGSSSLEIMTKSDAVTRYKLNPSNTTLGPKTANQCVAKRDLQTGYVHTVYKAANHAGLQNWTTAAAACAGTRDYAWTVYSSSATITTSSTLFYISGGVYVEFTVNGGSGEEQWIYDGTGAKPIRMTSTSSNVVAAVGSCDPATATLTITFESGLWFGELSAAIPSAGLSVAAGVARGYYDACLGAADETVDMWSDSGKVVLNGFSIPAGETINTGGYEPFEQFSGSVINYNMINNVEINGVARADGDTFTVGGTTVTLSLPLSCTPYA